MGTGAEIVEPDDWYIPAPVTEMIKFNFDKVYELQEFLDIIRTQIGFLAQNGLSPESLLEVLDIWEKRVLTLIDSDENHGEYRIGFYQDEEGVVRMSLLVLPLSR